MQPYLFPYIGYFQLMEAVDVFVMYDDVQYIKGGWINRNRINSKNGQIMFTLPLVKESHKELINERFIDMSQFSKWSKNTLKTIEQCYKKAPFYNDVINILLPLFADDAPMLLSEYIEKSLLQIKYYLGINTKLIKSSSLVLDDSFDRTDRLIRIVKLFGGTTYLNMIGGIDLYQKEDFEKSKIDLKFLEPNFKVYDQMKSTFTEGLSIIDVLMYNDVHNTKSMLREYILI